MEDCSKKEVDEQIFAGRLVQHKNSDTTRSCVFLARAIPYLVEAS